MQYTLAKENHITVVVGCRKGQRHQCSDSALMLTLCALQMLVLLLLLLLLMPAARSLYTAINTSSIGVCRGCCTPSCPGSAYLSESHTSSESSCSAASTVELHSIWWITLYRSRYGVSAASSFSQSTSCGRTASPSQHVWPPGFCCGWPDGLEFCPGQSSGSGPYYRQLQALVENVFVFNVPVRLAHWMCYDNALYNFTFLLTYLLTNAQCKKEG